MVAMETNPSLTQFLAWKLGKAMDRKATKEKRAHTFLQTTITLMLHIVGFSCLTIAGFTWSITAGWVIAGISCVVLARLVMLPTPPTTPADNRPQR